jgi:hypothetical protein
MRRLLVLAVSAALVPVAAGCTYDSGPAPGYTPPPHSASPTPVRITIPSVVGQNAATALDTLKGLGFTNIDLGTVDGNMMVLVPENWTVQTQTPPPGQRRQHGSKIVLGCTHNPW